jgi:hypothetical protein
VPADQLQPDTHVNAQTVTNTSRQLDHAAEEFVASAAIVNSPLSVVIDTSTSSPSPASSKNQHFPHSSLSSPLSSPESTPAQSPTSDTFTSSCVADECQPTALHPSRASTRVEPDAVRASRTSERLRSCPKLAYASPALRIGSARSSRRCQSARSKATAESSKSRPEPPTSCSCSYKVAPNFLSVVERKKETNTAEDLEIVMKYEAQQDLLCLKHLKMYAK